MPKHSLAKRVQSAYAAVDPRARWKKIQADLPEECQAVEDILGPMPVGNLNDIPLDKAVRYSARDADATCRIDRTLDDRHGDMGLTRVEEIDLGAVPMFARMQQVGIAADRKHFEDLSSLFDVLLDETEDKVNRIGECEINPGSNDQVGFLLFGQLGLKPLKMTKGGTRESVDEKTLQALRDQHPVIPPILHYRELQKLRGTYAEAIPKLIHSDGRIYADFRITRTPTGQLAVGSPNLLAMPVGSELGREIRRGFVAPPGTLLASFDYNQFHFRVMAHLSGDEKLCGLFQRGEDVHDATASEMFGIPKGQLDKVKHRLPAKRVGFGIINGITEVGLSAQFDLASEQGAEPHPAEECREFIDSWFEIYPGVRQFQKDAVCEARRYGFVRDMWGRIRYLPNIHSAIPTLREEAERQSFSHKIQGSAHGILKLAMASCWDYLQDFWRQNPKVRCEPILQVHDEKLYEVAESLTPDRSRFSEDIRTLMCGAAELRVPLESSGTFARNWAELK